MDKLIRSNGRKIADLEGIKKGIDMNKNLAAATKMLKAKPIVEKLSELWIRHEQLNLIRETKIKFLDRLDKKSAEYRYYISQIMTRKMEEAAKAAIDLNHKEAVKEFHIP